MSSSQSSGVWTRTELVTVAMALEEFRVDLGGGGEPDLAERVNAVLRGPGERFVLVPVEEPYKPHLLPGVWST